MLIRLGHRRAIAAPRRGRHGHRGALVAAILACHGATGLPGALAAISSSGDISPVPPPAGGAVAGPLHIGNVDVATMTINTSGGASPLSNTNSVLIGEAVTGIGIVNMSGFGSDWTLTSAGGDMTIGLFGAGSVSLSNLAFLSVFDDLFLAAQPNSSGKISISGFGTIVDVGDDANIGQRGQAVIDISNGGRLVTDQNIIGDEAAGDGRVIVQDQFSLWRTSNTMTIADAGRAFLQIFDGGRVETTAPSGIISATIASQAGSTGTVEVVGPGSIWQNALGIVVGDFGNGTLVVADGGRVAIGTGANLLTIGRQIGSIGHVEVSGPDSLLTAATAEVGDSGDGTLRILNGGRVTTGTVLMGDNLSARGEALVDGVGSTWEVTGEINVSDPGEGHLTISNGGLVRSSSITRVGALGRLTLDGGRLEIGGTVGLSNMGVVEGSGTIEALKVDNNSGATLRPFGAEPLLFTGTLNNLALIDVDAATLEVSGPVNNSVDIDARNGAVLRFGQTGLDNNSGSQLAITSGNVDVFGLVNNDAGGEIVVGATALAVFHDAVSNSGTIFVQPGGKVLMLENLGFTPAATLGLPLTGPGGIGQVSAAAGATLDGNLDVPLAGGFVPAPGDQFTVVSGSGLGGAFDTITTTAGAPVQFHGIYTPSEAKIFVAGAGDKTWGVDANGQSSIGANWFGGVAPGAVGDKAAFTTIITGDTKIDVDQPFTAGSLYFDDDNAYLLQGSHPITLDASSGAARIDVKNLHGSGAHVIETPLALNDSTVIDVAGGSVLSVTGPMTAAAGVALTKQGGGTLAVSHVRADGLAIDTGTARVLPDGGADGVSRVTSLAVATAAGARLDLTNNKLIVAGGTLGTWTGSAYDGVTGLIDAGRGNASNALWNGSGVVTSDTRAINTGDLTSLGVATAGQLGRTTFGGQSVAPTDVLVMFTYGGDANLDGKINIDDYGRIDGNVGQSGSVFGWSRGDFNYDGKINIDDYGIIDGNINRQGGPFPTSGGVDAASALAAVPEPGCLIPFCAFAGFLRWRRRNVG